MTHANKMNFLHQHSEGINTLNSTIDHPAIRDASLTIENNPTVFNHMPKHTNKSR